MLDVHPRVAYALICAKEDAILIDVRSDVEFLFVGHAKAAIHIPWYQEPKWEVNPHFIKNLRQVARSPERPILFICRNGNRSKEAGESAERHGFTQIYNVLHGFEGDLNQNNRRGQLNGWRYEDLPWEQC